MTLLTTFRAGARENLRALSCQPASLTSAQFQLDSVSAGFSNQASDLPSLFAMLAGSFTYRTASLGLASTGLFRSSLFSQIFRPVLALSAEVSAFRATHELLSVGESSSSWITDYVNFASLKFFGNISHQQNPYVSHFFQATGMVVGHQLAFGIGLATRPTGSLVEQWIHAEILNAQMQVSMGISSFLSGNKMAVLESSMQARAVLRTLNFTAHSRARSDVSLLHFSADVSEQTVARKRILDEIRASTRPLEQALESVENFRRTVLRELGDEPHQHREYDLWMDRLDQVNTRYLDLARKYQMLVAMFEPKGGAEKWDAARLEVVLVSVGRTMDRAREFLELQARVEFSNLEATQERNTTPAEIRLIERSSLANLRRLFERLNLANHLVERIFSVFALEAKSKDPFVLNGLEGLEGLLSGGGHDEREALVHFLERVSAEHMSDADSFQELLILGMNYQLGLLTRSSVIEIVTRTNQFHGFYPNAQGAFIEIFAKMHPHVSGDSALMAQALHFARMKLESGHSVRMVSHGHFGVAVMRVQKGEDHTYYGLSSVQGEVSSAYELNIYADRALSAVASAIERQEVVLPIRIYLALPFMTRRVTPLHLQAWGAQYLSEKPTQLRTKMVEEDLLRSIRGQTLTEAEIAERRTLLENARSLWVQQIEVAWYVRPGESSEIRSPQQVKSRERVVNTFEVIGPTSPSRDQLILGLQARLLQGNAEVESVGVLLDLLTEAGRQEDAIAALHVAIQMFPRKRGFRTLLRERFERELSNLNRAGEVDIANPDLNRIMARYFNLGNDFDISNWFRLSHPAYHYSLVKVDSRSGSLILKANLVENGGERAGNVTLRINYHEDSAMWVAQLSELDINEAHRSRAVSSYVMSSLLNSFGQLGVSRLSFSANQYGPYAWLRMGAEIPTDPLNMASAALINFAGQMQDDGITLNFPHRLSTGLKRNEFLENLHYLRETYPGYFREFILNKIPPMNYYFDLSAGSASRARFEEYFQSKRIP